MNDDTQCKEQDPTAGLGVDDVQTLAGRVIPAATIDGILGRKLDTLCNAFLAADETPHHDMLMHLRTNGVRGRDVIDHVIPATARRLGEWWMADRISFADVTIGTARLQEAVRALTARATNHGLRPIVSSATPHVLLILPKGEEHSLGVFVLADQMRREGCAVHLSIDQPFAEVARIVQSRRFFMVGVTVSGRRMLAPTANLVKKIRAAATRVTPVIIGGAVLDLDIDVRRATGADHVARTAREAMQVSGLSEAGALAERIGFERQAPVSSSGALRVTA